MKCSLASDSPRNDLELRPSCRNREGKACALVSSCSLAGLFLVRAPDRVGLVGLRTGRTLPMIAAGYARTSVYRAAAA